MPRMRRITCNSRFAEEGRGAPRSVFDRGCRSQPPSAFSSVSRPTPRDRLKSRGRRWLKHKPAGTTVDDLLEASYDNIAAQPAYTKTFFHVHDLLINSKFFFPSYLASLLFETPYLLANPQSTLDSTSSLRHL